MPELYLFARSLRQVWDLSAPPQANPLRSFEEHAREVRRILPLAPQLARQGLSLPIWRQSTASPDKAAHVCKTLLTPLNARLPRPPRARPRNRQVYSVAYNLVRRDSFVTASWDFTAKHWSLGHPHALRTFEEHGSCLYCASWCGPILPAAPRAPSCAACLRAAPCTGGMGLLREGSGALLSSPPGAPPPRRSSRLLPGTARSRSGTSASRSAR